MDDVLKKVLGRLSNKELLIIYSYDPNTLQDILEQEVLSRMDTAELKKRLAEADTADMPTGRETPEEIARMRQDISESSPAAAPKNRRFLSQSARQRIAAAQKKRWKEYHKTHPKKK